MRLDPYPVMYGRPLGESEWRKVFQLLEEVNLPKARTLSAVYREHVEPAWENYRRVYDEIMTRLDEDNRAINERRIEYEAMLQDYLDRLKDREGFWDERMKEPRDRYMHLSAVVERMPGAWTNDLARSVHGPREFAELINSIGKEDSEDTSRSEEPSEGSDSVDAGANTTSQTNGGQVGVSVGPNSSRNDQEGATVTDSPTVDHQGRSGSVDQGKVDPRPPDSNLASAEAPVKEIPILSKEEVADEGQLTTFADRPIAWIGRLVVTVVMGFLATFAFLRSTALVEVDWVSLSFGTAIASIILYGIWEATRSATAIASEAFHMRWRETFKRKLLVLIIALSLLVVGLFAMQFAWTWFLTSNIDPVGSLRMGHDAVAAHLLWLLWPWYLALAALDGLLRGRAEAMRNRIEAEIVRAERVERMVEERRKKAEYEALPHTRDMTSASGTAERPADRRAQGDSGGGAAGAAVQSPSNPNRPPTLHRPIAHEEDHQRPEAEEPGHEPQKSPSFGGGSPFPNANPVRPVSDSAEGTTTVPPAATTSTGTDGDEVALISEYRKARAEYESLRRQRDLDLAFLGKRIKDMQYMLRPFHWVPSSSDMDRINRARKQYEKIVGWFLDQVADALRDVGGGKQAGEIIRRLARSLGIDESGELREDLRSAVPTNGGEVR